MPDDSRAVLAAEARYRQAYLDGDDAALEALFDAALVYVHLSGAVDGKAGAIAARRGIAFRRMERRDPKVTIGGDVAVVSGPLEYGVDIAATAKSVEISIFLTQVLVRRDGEWRFTLVQATLLKMEGA
jgi:hypothetical protein